MSDKYYVCGLEIYDPVRKEYDFKLVRPTNGEPYVAKGLERGRHLHWLCKHHSHLYEIGPDHDTVSLVDHGEINYHQKNWKLLPVQTREIYSVIISDKCWLDEKPEPQEVPK